MIAKPLVFPDFHVGYGSEDMGSPAKCDDYGYCSCSPIKMLQVKVQTDLPSPGPSPSVSTSPGVETPSSLQSSTPSSTPGHSPATGVDDSMIPDVKDGMPKPEAGKIRLTQCAIDNRLRRIFHPRGPRPKRTVSEEMIKLWDKGGKSRKSLEQVFQSCGYDPDWGCQTIAHR